MTHEVTWGGTPLCETYGLFIEYGSVSCPPPSPKLSIVSIPGGVDLDLTDALTGHAAYEMRKVAFALYYAGRGGAPRQEVADAVVNLLHGAEADFSLSWDPGFTYHGRASVTSVELVGKRACRISVEITASPWKLRERHVLEVYADGGVSVTCPSGRRPVHPLVRAEVPVVVEWEGASVTVPAGAAYRLVGVTFSQGDNRLWLSTLRLRAARWSDLSGSAWADLASSAWGNVQVRAESALWSDLSGGTWADLSSRSWSAVADGGAPDVGGLVTVEWEESYL